jgi:adhesin transport system membrane fusion protein
VLFEQYRIIIYIMSDNNIPEDLAAKKQENGTQPSKVNVEDILKNLTQNTQPQQPESDEAEQEIVLEEINEPSALAFVIFSVTLVAVCVTMFFVRVESVISGQGAVEAGLGVQEIKSQEGGILEDLYVRKGEKVTVGQELALLSNSSIIAKVDEIRSELSLLRVKQYRLEQEKKGAKNLVWPDSLADVNSSIKNVQSELFESRTQRFMAELETLRFEIQTLRKELLGARKELSAIDDERKSVKNILDFRRQGYNDGFVGKSEVLQAESQYAQISRELVRTRARIPAIQSQISEKLESLQERTFKHQQSVDDELEEVSLRSLVLNAEVSAASDQDDRRVLRSPIDAIINDVHVIGPGDVVQAAEPILDLVPVNSGLTINAKIDPSLRRGLYTGLPTKVSFTALQDLRAAPMEGKVTFVAADTQTDPEGAIFYEVHIQTTAASLTLPNGESASIEPGMQAMVSIIVGEHSLSDFLLRPFEWVFSNAFRER